MSVNHSIRHPSRRAGRAPFLGRRLWLESLELRAVPATVVWDGGPAGNGTNWFDAVNWAGNVLPGPNDAAVIGAGAVVLDGNTSVQSISIAPQATLTITEDPVINGAFNNSGTLTITADTTWNTPAGSTNVNSGTVNVAGGNLTLNLPSSPVQTFLTNSGTISVSSGRTFAVYGQLTNYNKSTHTLSGGVYNLAGAFTFQDLWYPPPFPPSLYTPVDIQILNADVTLSAAGAAIRDARTGANCLTPRTITATSHLTVVNGASVSLGSVGGTNTNFGELTIGLGSTVGGNMVNSGRIIGSGLFGGILDNRGVVLIGTPVATFTVGGSLMSGGLGFELFAPTPGTGYDQIVALTNVFLNGGLGVGINAGFTVAPGTVFRIIDNRGTQAVIGTFTGLPEGATVTAGGQQFRISYVGGDGNDVTLTREPVPTTFRWDGHPDAGGTSTSNFWLNPENWVGDVAPTAGAALVFPAGAALTSIVNNFPAGTVFSTMSVTGPGYLIGGNVVAFASGVTVDFASGGSTTTLALPLAGGGGLTKGGGGSLELSQANTYLGATTITGGRLDLSSLGGPAVPGSLVITGGKVLELVDGQVADAAPVAINPGATFDLNGHADAVGKLVVTGGTVFTGGGRLTAGNTSFDANANLGVSLAGAAGSGGVAVNGAVALGGTLQLTLAAPVPVGTQVTLIDNDGTDVVTGSFANFAEGATVAIGASMFRVTYHGGVGQNDVVITAIDPAIGQISGTVFTDVNGNGTNNGDPGRDGITVQLDVGADGTVDRSTTTANGGRYSFGGLPISTFRVRIAAPAGIVQTTAGPNDVTLAFGQSVGGVNVGVFQLVSIGGTKFNDRNGDGVRNPNEPGVGGVEVRLTKAGAAPRTVTTSADGSFSFADVGPGVFQVREATPAGTTQTTPDPLDIATSSGSDVTGVLFGNRVNRVELFAVGAGSGGGPYVNAYDVDGSPRFRFLAYDAKFTGGVRVTTGDVNGDGVDDIVTAAGTGGRPHVKVFDGTSLALLQSFFAYSPAFTGGVFVAAGDVNGDGFADVVTGAGTGGGPHVEVFSGTDLGLLRSFMAFDPAFAGGVYVAAGDVDADGRADVIVGTGAGRGPHVLAFSGQTGSLLNSFFAYDPNYRGGVRVAAGDVNGDGRADVITGAGPGGGPHVRVFDAGDRSELDSLLAFDPAFLGGVFVG